VDKASSQAVGETGASSLGDLCRGEHSERLQKLTYQVDHEIGHLMDDQAVTSSIKRES